MRTGHRGGGKTRLECPLAQQCVQLLVRMRGEPATRVVVAHLASSRRPCMGQMYKGAAIARYLGLQLTSAAASPFPL